MQERERERAIQDDTLHECQVCVCHFHVNSLPESESDLEEQEALPPGITGGLQDQGSVVCRSGSSC